jgi:ABC-type bacteriocin/lantibiotic exporter with double-glycine peptidase domain
MNYKIYKKKINFDKKINLKNINFKFNNFCIFKNLNLTIKKDLKLAIVGKSGIGKSTLLDLITGLKFPDSGKIFIDKKILSIKFSHSWIDNFSYVSQKTFMFNSSVRSNITFEADNKNIDINKFNESIKVSNLKNFLNLKLEKEFFLISEYGKNLSGGQIQQIGIARAIYANRPIIIFDESINALDSINKNIIINNLLSLKNKTIILITHSADNIKKFNEVYEIKNKTISQIK